MTEKINIPHPSKLQNMLEDLTIYSYTSSKRVKKNIYSKFAKGNIYRIIQCQIKYS